MLSDESRSRSKFFSYLVWIKNLAFENLKGSRVRKFLGFRELNDFWAVGKRSKVVCTVLCWHEKIALRLLAASANKIRLKQLYLAHGYG